MHNTANNYFMNATTTSKQVFKDLPFLLKNYEVKIFSSYLNKDKNPSYLARMQGLMAKALEARH